MAKVALQEDVDKLFRAWLDECQARDAFLSTRGKGDPERVAEFRESCDRLAQAWFERVKHYLYGISFRIVRDRQHSEDAVQSTLATILRTSSRPKAGTCALWWIAKIAVQQSARALKFRNRGMASFEADIGEKPEIDRNPRLYSRDTQARSLPNEVADAVLRLPRDLRLPLELVGVNDMTHAEVAQLLEIPEGTVKSRIDLAKSRVSEMLTGRGLFLSMAQVELLILARPIEKPSAEFVRNGAQIPSYVKDALPAKSKLAVMGSFAAAVLVVTILTWYVTAKSSVAKETGDVAAAPEPPDSKDLTPKDRPTSVARRDNIHLPPPETIMEGTVLLTDSEGITRPAAGAEVSVLAFEMSPFISRSGGPPQPTATAWTDERGMFRTSIPPTETYFSVRAAMGLHYRSTQVIRALKPTSVAPGFGPGLNRIGSLILTPAGAIQGRVTLENGEPVSGAIVKCVNIHNEDVANATTDSDGRVTVIGIPPGPVRVVVQRDSVVKTMTSHVVMANTTILGQAWTLTECEWRDVKVIDTERNPVPFAVFVDDNAGTRRAANRADESGRRRVLAPLGFVSEVKVAADPYDIPTSARLVKPGDDGIVTLTIPALVKFSVSCVDAVTGKPVEGFTVFAATESGTKVSEIQTSRNGIAGLAVNPTRFGRVVKLNVRARGYADGSRDLSEAAGPVVCELALGAVVKGRYVNPDGKGVAFARVAVARGLDLIVMGETLASGDFSLANVPPGEYSLYAWKTDRPNVEKSISISAADTTVANTTVDVGSLEMHLGGTVHLTLPANAPSPVHYQFYYSPAGESGKERQLENFAVLSPGKSSTWTGLPPGKWRVVRTFGAAGIRHVQKDIHKFELNDGEVKTVTLECAEPATIQGRLVKSVIPPEMLDAFAFRSDEPRHFTTRVDADGSFEFRDIPSGHYYTLTFRLRGSPASYYGAQSNTEFWQSAQALLAHADLAQNVAQVLAQPGDVVVHDIHGSLATATADLTQLAHGAGRRLEICYDSEGGRKVPPWVVVLESSSLTSLGIPAGEYLVRVFDGEVCKGEFKSKVEDGGTAVWKLPDSR